MNFKHDKQRLTDIAVVMAAPIVCLFIYGWQQEGQFAFLFGFTVILLVGCSSYFFPDRDTVDGGGAPAHVPEKKIMFPEGRGNAEWPYVAGIILFGLAVLGWLMHGVWIHAIFNGFELAIAALGFPLAVVLVSYFVMRMAANHFKKSGLRAPEGLLWTLVVFWCAATFVFIFCIVPLIWKIGLNW